MAPVDQTTASAATRDAPRRATRRTSRAGLLAGVAALVASVPSAAAAGTGSHAWLQGCGGMARGLPVYGVRYLPHLVGEPYPHPESRPRSLYTKEFQDLHERDLPLIGERLAANALSLAPWPTDGASGQHAGFLRRMAGAGLCKVIPTFHLAKYYADMLREGVRSPRADSHSALAVEFMRFGGSVAPEVMQGVEMAAWTVDMSLDLAALLPQVASECAYSKVTQQASFTNYMRLMDALQHWVRPPSALGAHSGARMPLREVPMLIPLDLSRVSWTEPAFATKLTTFLRCMSTSYDKGGWSTLFTQSNQTEPAPRPPSPPLTGERA